ncbi:MAG: DUF421 domain-containing protein [Bacteroidetes bacterium]|nr:DUF421 domain-containing protein [Bacteroidota bacterium]
MDLLIKIFGEGKELSTLQMVSRGIVVFVIALLLLRISGRRSFGLRTPLDNIISITLGAVLSRAIAGVSPFVPVVVTCLVVVSLHRILGWLIIRYKWLEQIMEGRKFLLFTDGEFVKETMDRALVQREDVMQGVRKTALTENMDKIKAVYMERNGEISVITKGED